MLPWLLPLLEVSLRASQAKTLAHLALAAVRVSKLTLAEIGRQLLGVMAKSGINQVDRFLGNARGSQQRLNKNGGVWVADEAGSRCLGALPSAGLVQWQQLGKRASSEVCLGALPSASLDFGTWGR